MFFFLSVKQSQLIVPADCHDLQNKYMGCRINYPFINEMNRSGQNFGQKVATLNCQKYKYNHYNI